MAFISFGEIMLRLTPEKRAGKICTSSTFHVNYAGSESNVVSSLAVLGNPVQFVTKLPLNAVADGCMMSLKSFGIGTRYINRGGNRMGTYFIETGSSIRPSQVVYDRAGSAISAIGSNEFDWEVIFRNREWLFISGITPALSENCAEETIKAARIAKKMGLKVAFDMNFRRTLWNDKKDARKLFNAILEHTHLLFGNMGVLKDVYDMTFTGSDIIEKTQKAIEWAQKEFNLDSLAFTIREHDSASSNRLSGICMLKGSLYLSDVYHVGILDRFGTGDAFAAGFLHGLHGKWDPEKCIRFATAAFALKHTIKGDQHTSNENEILSIMNGNTTGHVLR